MIWENEEKDISEFYKEKTKWDYKSVKAEALKYNDKTTFNKKARTAQQWAIKNGLYEEITSHMFKPKRWDYESTKKEALKYNSKKEFKENSKGASNWMYQHNKTEEFTKHMTPAYKNLKWTPESIELEIAKYKTKKEFLANARGAYHWIIKNKYPSKFSVKKRKKWDYESAKKEALKYKTKKEFLSNSIGASNWIYRNKKTAELTKHMK